MEIFLTLSVFIKILSIADSWVTKSYILMVESFAAVNQLVITFSMVKCVLKLNTVWSVTIRSDLKLQKVKKR
jgi:hypothetical protein